MASVVRGPGTMWDPDLPTRRLATGAGSLATPCTRPKLQLDGESLPHDLIEAVKQIASLKSRPHYGDERHDRSGGAVLPWPAIFGGTGLTIKHAISWPGCAPVAGKRRTTSVRTSHCP